MKKKLIKFFEIGKLERGLFRVWIVLSIIWFISSYIFYSSKYEIENHKFWSFASSEPKIFCKPQFKHVKKPFEFNGMTLFTWEKSQGTVWAHMDKYNQGKILNLDLQKVFNSRDDCIEYYLKKKLSAYKYAAPTYLTIFLTPFLISILYLFSKKTFLWVRRGFK